MLKNPCTIVCDMSRMLIWLSARYVHTRAMMPTVSLPTTVIIALVIVMGCLRFYYLEGGWSFWVFRLFQSKSGYHLKVLLMIPSYVYTEKVRLSVFGSTGMERYTCLVYDSSSWLGLLWTRE